MLAVEQRLVMFGGCNFALHRCYNETYAYDPSAARWEQLPHHTLAPSSRQGAAALAQTPFSQTPCDVQLLRQVAAEKSTSSSSSGRAGQPLHPHRPPRRVGHEHN